MEQLLIKEPSDKRLDVYLCRKYPQYSRGYFQRLIKAGRVTVNHKQVTPHQALKPGDVVDIELVDQAKKPIVPESIPLDVIFEDDDIVVVNKPAGLVVHPACGHPTGTLVNALSGRAKGSFSPLLVHRLDKDTSGVMVVAKNERAKNSLVKQFQKRAVKKVYLAAVKGRIHEQKGRIEAPLGRSPEDRKKMTVGPLARKMAVTEFTVKRATDELSLIEARPVTGRTHQIRSHLAFIGHPVLGDAMYGGPEKTGGRVYSRQVLHAYRLSFSHPSTGRTVEFCAPPPEDIAEIWKEKK